MDNSFPGTREHEHRTGSGLPFSPLMSDFTSCSYATPLVPSVTVFLYRLHIVAHVFQVRHFVTPLLPAALLFPASLAGPLAFRFAGHTLLFLLSFSSIGSAKLLISPLPPQTSNASLSPLGVIVRTYSVLIASIVNLFTSFFYLLPVFINTSACVTQALIPALLNFCLPFRAAPLFPPLRGVSPLRLCVFFSYRSSGVHSLN